MAKTRSDKTVCPSCGHLDFSIYYGEEYHLFGYPEFHCEKCGRVWSGKRNGKPYIDWVTNPKDILNND